MGSERSAEEGAQRRGRGGALAPHRAFSCLLAANSARSRSASPVLGTDPEAAGGTSPRSPAVSRGSCAASAAPACSLPRRQPSNGQSRAGAENRWAQRGAQRKGRSDESEAGRWLRTGRSPA